MSDFINTIDVIGDELLTAQIIERTITEYKDNTVKKIGRNAFAVCGKLKTLDVPEVTSIEGGAFYNCGGLTMIELPKVTSIGDSVFNYCRKISSMDYPKATSIEASAFNNCNSLTTLILRSETMCTLANTNAFGSCYHFIGTVNGTYNPNGLKDGYIYVPSALMDSYKAATNWSTYADRFRALEDYTVDGTTTGALDESKI